MDYILYTKKVLKAVGIFARRKPYFIWTIFFTIVDELKPYIGRITGRKPYFIWTIFFTIIEKKQNSVTKTS